MSDWHSFLLANGGFTDAQGKATFSQPDLPLNNTYLMPLQQQGLLSVKGPDAARFLQGQITCDVRELEAHSSRLGAQCNLKGRMLLCFRALQIQYEQIVLRMHQNLIANGMSSFGKYIVFSKAKLADISNDYRCIGVAGVNASDILATVLGVQIADDDGWQAAGNSIVIRINEHRFECWLAIDEAEHIWQELAKHCQPAGDNLWTLLDIQSGLGNITPDTYEAFTPQAINLQLVNGVNFRKGCYTGQEIVARLHYRGSLKRHMYRFEFTGKSFLTAETELPRPGSELHNSQGKVVGEIVMAAAKTASCGELLASVVDDQRIDLYLPGNPQKLSLLSLPYAIPTADEAS